MSQPIPRVGRWEEAQFHKEFPDNEACIKWLARQAYPEGITCKKCRKVTPHNYYKPYQSFQCEICGTHYQPIIGTVYQKKGIPIKKWFHTIYMITTKGRYLTMYELCHSVDIDIHRARYMQNKLKGLL